MAELVIVEKPPMLLFEVGVFEAVPRGFGEALGEELETTIIAGKTLRAVLKAERQARGYERPVQHRDVTRRLFGQARSLLEKGEDVFADVFFNTKRARADTPLELAQLTGADTVALNLVTPRAHVHKTVRKLMEEGKLSVAGRQRSPFAGVSEVYRHMQRPTSTEGIDLIINLDGRAPIPELVDQVVECLEAHRA